MSRKLVLALLAMPFVLTGIYLLLIPEATRAILFSEFKHNVAVSLGYEPDSTTGTDGKLGLRSEHPEEYGFPTDEDESEEDRDLDEDPGQADTVSESQSPSEETEQVLAK